MKIYVTGGLKSGRSKDKELADALGRAIVQAGHTVLQGYYNEFDHRVAAAAYAEAGKSERFADPQLAVQSFITSDRDPPMDVAWPVRRLPFRDWDPREENWSVPEPIRSCDVAIVVGGGPATLRAANLCRLTNKPILPITVLGGSAVEVFREELRRFSVFYKGRIAKEEYTRLDIQNPRDFAALAKEVVELAPRLAISNSVFIIMAFRDESEDTFSTIKDICKEHGLEWHRPDQDPTTDRIYERIVAGIQRARFIVADVTIATLNVYYELGYAEALGKPVIVVAREGTELPFDTRDVPTTLFRNQTRLKEALRTRFEALLGMEFRLEL